MLKYEYIHYNHPIKVRVFRHARICKDMCIYSASWICRLSRSIYICKKYLHTYFSALVIFNISTFQAAPKLEYVSISHIFLHISHIQFAEYLSNLTRATIN